MEDLISRKALLDAMPKNDILLSMVVRQVIADAPWVDAVPVRHGKWKVMGDCGATVCSECKWSIEEYVGDYNYCPACGAKMDGGGA